MIETEVETTEFEQSMERLAAYKRRERRLRYATVLLGVLLLVVYIIFGLTTGLWGVGLGIVPVACMLMLIGGIGIVVSKISGLS